MKRMGNNESKENINDIKNEILADGGFEDIKNNKFDDKYIYNCSIGAGGYSDVFLVTEKETKKLFCEKKMKSDIIKDIADEWNILLKCNHFGIVKAHEIFANENIMVMEFLSGKTLKQIIRDKRKKKEMLDERFIIDVLYQLCIILDYLHSKNIIHRDIKSSNIIITKDGVVKLIDFGLSFFKKEANYICGTPYYVSPEMYKKEYYDESIDVWSLGVAIFELIELDYPFKGRTCEDIKYKVIHADIYFCNGHLYSKELLDMIRYMLEKDQWDRLTVKELLNQKIMKEAGKKFAERINNSSSLDNEARQEILDYIGKVNFFTSY